MLWDESNRVSKQIKAEGKKASPALKEYQNRLVRAQTVLKEYTEVRATYGNEIKQKGYSEQLWEDRARSQATVQRGADRLIAEARGQTDKPLAPDDAQLDEGEIYPELRDLIVLQGVEDWKERQAKIKTTQTPAVMAKRDKSSAAVARTEQREMSMVELSIDSVKDRLDATASAAKSVSGLKDGKVYVINAGNAIIKAFEGGMAPDDFKTFLIAGKKYSIQDSENVFNQRFTPGLIPANIKSQVMASRKMQADRDKLAAVKRVCDCLQKACTENGFIFKNISWDNIFRTSAAMYIMKPVAQELKSIGSGGSFAWIYSDAFIAQCNAAEFLSFSSQRLMLLQKVINYYLSKDQVELVPENTSSNGFIIKSVHNRLLPEGAKHYMGTSGDGVEGGIAEIVQLRPETHAQAIIKCCAILDPRSATRCSDYKIAEGTAKSEMLDEICQNMRNLVAVASMENQLEGNDFQVNNNDSKNMQVYFAAKSKLLATKNAIARLMGVKGGSNTRSQGAIGKTSKSTVKTHLL